MDSTAVGFKLCKAVSGECAGPGEYREKGEGTRVSYATTCDSAAFIHTLPHTHPQSPPRRVEQDTQTNRDGSERTNERTSQRFGCSVQFSFACLPGGEPTTGPLCSSFHTAVTHTATAATATTTATTTAHPPSSLLPTAASTASGGE